VEIFAEKGLERAVDRRIQFVAVAIIA